MDVRESLKRLKEEDLGTVDKWWSMDNWHDTDQEKKLKMAVLMLMKETGRPFERAVGWLLSRTHYGEPSGEGLFRMAEEETLRARGCRVAQIAETTAVAWISEHGGEKLKGCVCGWVLDWCGRERLLVFRPEYRFSDGAAGLRGRDVLLEWCDPDGEQWRRIVHVMPPLENEGGADGELLCFAMPDGQASAWGRWERGEALA